MRSVIGLVAWIGLCLLVGWGGSVFTARSVGDWYAGLNKPSWTPPGAVFAPVWTALYVMMGVAAWLVWRRGGLTAVAVPLVLFGIQLALNVAWSAIFFGLRQPGWAFVEIVALWALILATVIAFRRISPTAGYLLLPYLAWVTFAAALNLAIWRANA
jgi:tryptophan-rich sensory protein